MKLLLIFNVTVTSWEWERAVINQTALTVIHFTQQRLSLTLWTASSSNAEIWFNSPWLWKKQWGRCVLSISEQTACVGVIVTRWRGQRGSMLLSVSLLCSWSYSFFVKHLSSMAIFKCRRSAQRPSREQIFIDEEVISLLIILIWY